MMAGINAGHNKNRPCFEEQSNFEPVPAFNQLNSEIFVFWELVAGCPTQALAVNFIINTGLTQYIFLHAPFKFISNKL